jgi:hypothetical protein
MKKYIYAPTLSLLLIGCTTSSKPDSSDGSKTQTPAVTATPLAVDTAVQVQNIAAEVTKAVEYPEYLPWEYTFYGISSTSPVVAAFEQSGLIYNNSETHKGELEFYVVDVEKNNYVTPPYFDFSEGKHSEVARRDIKGILKQYNLPDNDFKKTILSSKGDHAPVMINNQEHSLNLIQTEVHGKLIFELQLINLKTRQGWVLQKDQLLPSSRGEVIKYSLKDAYVKGDNIAVIIHYDRIGGTTAGKPFKLGKYLIVTGSVGITPSL